MGRSGPSRFCCVCGNSSALFRVPENSQGRRFSAAAGASFLLWLNVGSRCVFPPTAGLFPFCPDSDAKFTSSPSFPSELTRSTVHVMHASAVGETGAHVAAKQARSNGDGARLSFGDSSPGSRHGPPLSQSPRPLSPAIAPLSLPLPSQCWTLASSLTTGCALCAMPCPAGRRIPPCRARDWLYDMLWPMTCDCR